jgi:hypothetical protein
MGKQANSARLHWLRVRLITDSVHGGGKRGQEIGSANKKTEQRNGKPVNSECVQYSQYRTVEAWKDQAPQKILSTETESKEKHSV